MKIIDIIVPAIIFILALAYLYRIFFVKKGCSCGSSSCSSAKREKTIEGDKTQDLKDDNEKSCTGNCCCSK